MTDEEATPGETPRGYDREVTSLKLHATEMGYWALAMVHDGWTAFQRCDLELAQRVLDRDERLAKFEVDIEHETISFLLLRKPAGKDLRTAVAILKATTYLDRIGRLGFDMARITTPESRPDLPELREHLQNMDILTESQVALALDALEHDKYDLARSLFDRDNEIDRMHRETNRIAVRQLLFDPMSGQRTSNEILVARHFERIADNACRIAERTIYALTGQRPPEYLPHHPSVPYVLERPTAQDPTSPVSGERPP
ncbi:MAG: phosphate signaling complex protein PhoU [Thermoplasmata archaeon]